jgi:hypothetical protein
MAWIKDAEDAAVVRKPRGLVGKRTKLSTLKIPSDLYDRLHDASAHIPHSTVRGIVRRAIIAELARIDASGERLVPINAKFPASRPNRKVRST